MGDSKQKQIIDDKISMPNNKKISFLLKSLIDGRSVPSPSGEGLG
jgi:hypothetical protein